ncbi:PhnE/PtxC family ABC transporter permease [Vagococcus bubulae]|uniref:PhnE/PtxC family ABC transporter permease n=1 Tax=Vagococcus bubulae TaxID=1977868 RepID=UPI001FB2B2E0|nr:ABC transporter permease subunit [Vagococcus bubulae]
MKDIPLTQKKDRIRTIVITIAAIVLFVVSVNLLNLDMVTFISRFEQSGEVVKHFLALDTSDVGEVFAQLLLSLSMAIASLFLGAIISFILACLGADNISPLPFLSAVIKGVMSVIRAIPSLVWILMIVASLGFGSMAGIIGMMFPTVGYLTKSFISSIEEVPIQVIETMKSTGANWFQLIQEGILPNVSKSFLNWLAIRVEGNVAESISLGMVGAGGIGTLLTRAISSYNYGRITFIVLTIFCTMFAVEMLVTRAKKAI